MQFNSILSTHLTTEWRVQYMNYENLKTMLLTAVDNSPSNLAFDLRSIRNYYANFDEKFFQQCERELKKVNRFFEEKLSEAHRKHVALETELYIYLDEVKEKENSHHGILTKKKIKTFRENYSEYYLSLVLLQNYQSLNYTSFQKILQKHDKLVKMATGVDWLHDIVDCAYFHIDRELMNLLRDTEDKFTSYFENGDRTRALNRLRISSLNSDYKPGMLFSLGSFTGVLIILIIFAVYTCAIVFTKQLTIGNYTTLLRIYRGPFLFILFLFFCGLNIKDWRKAGINYMLILNIDPCDHITSLHIMQLAMAFAVLWTLSILGFFYCNLVDVPRYIFPLALFWAMIGYLINPLPIMNYNARMWLLKVMGRVISAPCLAVNFANFWLAEQLLSLVTCLVDYEYIICFYTTNWDYRNASVNDVCSENMIIIPILQCLPAWFCFAQSARRFTDKRSVFPFLCNAGKYATTFPVVIFGTLSSYYKDVYSSTFQNPFVWGYLISSIISTVYFYAWDVFRDFGVFKKFSGDNIFLREQVVYEPCFYYFAMIENLLIRFYWIFAFYVEEQRYISKYCMTTIGACLEIFRRYIWNYLRLENEQLYNLGKFRTMQDISLSPIYSNDEATLLRMMEEIDGVTNREVDV
ncbi:xenotropic and polytropic retrovirus receptor 1-like [Teleopsis dalmanni]|uniref:xenotropic and polytropic retrovirus receptor 1-like n=1 Tax=Teleopsis dalmanni TaxID=139649 RepID=UPI0018CF77F1|nr:xenotropic and polytropic retrovirus receptor 1-like [Teleopsis dalmanni]